MIVVLGSTGFVGGALVRHLQGTGANVRGCSRKDIDLLDPASFQNLPDETSVLIHAATAFEKESPDDEVWRINVQATAGLAARLKQCPRLRRVIYLSSGAVYAPTCAPVTTADPLRPASLYGLTKLLAETTLQCAGLPAVCCVRLFFPFGPGQRLPRLIPRLAQSIRSGNPVFLSSATGGPVINPLPIDRLVELLTSLITLEALPPVVNLGGPVALTIKELAVHIGEFSGHEPVFEVKEASGSNSSNFYCIPNLDPGPDEQFWSTLRAAVAVSD